MRLLVVDTETTGENPAKHSLISFAGVLWEDGIIGQEFYANVWPDKSPLWNNWSIEHVENVGRSNSLDYDYAFAWLRQEICRRFEDTPITVAGHNVEFDIKFLNQLGDISSLISRRTVDTHSIAFALQAAGVIPTSQKLDLTSLCEYFNIQVSGRHTALGDAVATAELFTKLTDLMRA